MTNSDQKCLIYTIKYTTTLFVLFTISLFPTFVNHFIPDFSTHVFLPFNPTANSSTLHLTNKLFLTAQQGAARPVPHPQAFPDRTAGRSPPCASLPTTLPLPQKSGCLCRKAGGLSALWKIPKARADWFLAKRGRV